MSCRVFNDEIKHRLTIFVDTFSGFSYGQRHECGVTHHRYGKHRQLYAMSSHRPALWASGNKSLVFISEEVEDELSKDLGRKLYFSKVTKGYYTLDVRMGHEHLLSNQKQTAVVDAATPWSLLVEKTSHTPVRATFKSSCCKYVSKRLSSRERAVRSRVFEDAVRKTSCSSDRTCQACRKSRSQSSSLDGGAARWCMWKGGSQSAPTRCCEACTATVPRSAALRPEVRPHTAPLGSGALSSLRRPAGPSGRRSRAERMCVGTRVFRYDV